MLVWPPMPLQPDDEGSDRKLAHSLRLALPMMNAPAAFSRAAMNASAGVLPASAQEPAVVGMPVGAMLSLTHSGSPATAGGVRRLRGRGAAARAVGLTVITALSIGLSWRMRRR